MMLMSFLEKHFNKQRTPSPSKKASRRRPDEANTPSGLRRGDREEGSGGALREAVHGIKAMFPPGVDEDYETELANKGQRDAQLGWMLAFVSGSVGASWALGASGASVAWLLLLLALLVAIWRASLRRLIDSTVRYETLRVARRRALSADETAEWFNFLVNRWWVFSSPSLYALIREHLEPLLNEVKPSMVERLELRHFTLGDQTPHVRSVRAFDVTGTGARRPLSAATLARPPAGLALRLNHQVVLEADVRLDCDDFRMVLRARLGKGVGMDMDMAMEKLNISGRVHVTCSLSMDAPFPHVTHLSLSFLERPEVWFSVRVLKAVQMMEVPLLKTWIHSVVMEALVTSLVDPGKLDVNLVPADRPSAGRGPGDTLAQGVLTVTLSLPAPNAASDVGKDRDRAHSGTGLEGDARWLVLCLGEQRMVTPHLGPRWQHTGSFLMSSLHSDKLLVKLKTKRFVSAITLAQFELPLASYNLESNKVVETVLHKKLTKVSSGTIPNIAMRFEYTPLPIVNLDGAPDTPVTTPTEGHTGVAGVIMVCIHNAEGLALPGVELKDCNPYCMVFNNRKKVKTTHFLKATGTPQWESKSQFLVSDFTQANLSFVVCSWGRDKAGDTDLLGITTFTLSQEENNIIKRKLPLSSNMAPAGRGSCTGTITVSVVFHAVSSVAQSVHKGFSKAAQSPGGSDEDDSSVSSGRSKKSGSNWMQQAKQLLTCKEQENNADISSLLANGLGLMEVSLIKAKDLVAKDLNGFSDPYCELKVNGECKYKSSIKKKTLNPTWEESAIMGMPRTGENLELVIWDHDVFGMKDFLGNVKLTADDIRHLSSLDLPQWRQLQGVKTGSVEFRVKVISEVTEVSQLMDCSSIDGMTQRLAGLQTTTNASNQSSNTPNKSQQQSRNASVDADRAKLRLALDHGPPAPPLRTVSANYKPTTVPLIKQPTDSEHRSNGGSHVTNGHASPAVSQSGAPSSLASSPSTAPSMTVPGSGSLTPSPEPVFKKNQNEYSSFRMMKNKMKRGLTLRRFRSEVHVNGSDCKNGGAGASVALSIEPRGAGEADATELLHGEAPMLSHAVSQPNIPSVQPSPRPASAASLAPSIRRPTDLKVRSISTRPEKFIGIEGKVIQAQGLHVAHIAQLYCRVRLHSGNSPEKAHRGGSSSGGKTLAKSRLIPAVPNPRFDLAFELDAPEGVSRMASLVFEVRATGKELVTSRRITMQDLLSDSSPETEVRTWLALNTGASIEVEIAYGREPKKGSRRLFRSWSVHRIGKI